ncbi:MAG: glutamate--tRNA ligase [Acidobacteria bacterium]|nr:glutamate--tRNA ligase [Acidobacteriota bacterium]
MAVRVRFAPSPTGELHVGNARTALFNWLYARRNRGVFVLRIEDTDVERSEARYEGQLMQDLRWLGLDWEEGPDHLPDRGGAYGPYRQSERLALYQRYARELIAAGSAYYCFCSPDELEKDRRAAQAAGRQQIYSGKCRALPPAEAISRKEAGETASVRLRVPDEPLRFEDLVSGTVEFSPDVIGDPILLRSNGTAAYNYAVVIDDGLMQITHVIRGDDHISNTPRQMAVYHALARLPSPATDGCDWRLPQFAHLSTILGPDHTRLSKRHGVTSLAHFRERGILPEALANYLALLGWAPSGGDREIFSLPELVEAFSLEQVSRSPAIFDPVKLHWMNRHYLKQSDPERVLDLAIPIFRAAGQIGESPGEDLRRWLRGVVELLLPAVDDLSQLPEQARVIFEYDAAASIANDENQQVLAEPGARQVIEGFAEQAQQDEELTVERFRAALDHVKKTTRQKGKSLFQPVRIALTGSPSGRQLDRLVPLLEAGSRLELPKPVKSCRQRLMEFQQAWQR